MPAKQERKSRKARERKTIVDRHAWLEAARRALVRDGVRGVEVIKLARALGASRSSFYWMFSSRRQLLNALLKDWEKKNNQAFQIVVDDDAETGRRKIARLANVWIDESGYDSAWDAAVRDWARTDPEVAQRVHRVDDSRIALFKKVFKEVGYGDLEAFVRARVLYFHQVGYYALGIRESRLQRRKLRDHYTRVFIDKQ